MKIEQSFDLMLLAALYSFVVLFGIAFFYQRFRSRRRKARGKANWGFYPGAASLGNALHQLSVMADPQAEHAITEIVSEESEDDDEGAPRDPVAHLHRQARKIRRGEKVDRLTALKRF
jgi:hypothetical protein